MKKIIVLFVLTFGLMSLSSTDSVYLTNYEDVVNTTEVLCDYEISVKSIYSEEIDCWTCTLTVYHPDFTTTTIEGNSCISPAMACHYARQELMRRIEGKE